MNFYNSRRRLSLPVTQMSIDNANMDTVDTAKPTSARHASEQMGMKNKKEVSKNGATPRKNGSLPDLIEEVQRPDYKESLLGRHKISKFNLYFLKIQLKF